MVHFPRRKSSKKKEPSSRESSQPVIHQDQQHQQQHASSDSQQRVPSPPSQAPSNSLISEPDNCGDNGAHIHSSVPEFDEEIQSTTDSQYGHYYAQQHTQHHQNDPSSSSIDRSNEQPKYESSRAEYERNFKKSSTGVPPSYNKHSKSGMVKSHSTVGSGLMYSGSLSASNSGAIHSGVGANYASHQMHDKSHMMHMQHNVSLSKASSFGSTGMRTTTVLTNAPESSIQAKMPKEQFDEDILDRHVFVSCDYNDGLIKLLSRLQRHYKFNIWTLHSSLSFTEKIRNCGIKVRTIIPDDVDLFDYEYSNESSDKSKERLGMKDRCFLFESAFSRILQACMASTEALKKKKKRSNSKKPISRLNSSQSLEAMDDENLVNEKLQKLNLKDDQTHDSISTETDQEEEKALSESAHETNSMKESAMKKNNSSWSLSQYAQANSNYNPSVAYSVNGDEQYDSNYSIVRCARFFELVVVNISALDSLLDSNQIPYASMILKDLDIFHHTLIRTCIKNYTSVSLLCQSSQYEPYIEQLMHNFTFQTTLRFRQLCARDALWEIALYDWSVASYMTREFDDSPFPNHYSPLGHFFFPLRYGENTHQQASFYRTGQKLTGWATSKQLSGKTLSYNNLLDLESGRLIAEEFISYKSYVAIIVKHSNPCACGMSESQEKAYRKAFHADPVSAFGGTVAFNRPIDTNTAKAICESFIECVVAEGISSEGLKICKERRPKMRVLILPSMIQRIESDIRCIAGGFLMQAKDHTVEDENEFKVLTKIKPSSYHMEQMIFAWRIVKHVKSNAIVIVKDGVTVGIGAGQPNRISAVSLAVNLAGYSKTRGAVLASDGFFHFDESIKVASDSGIAAIIQPGGSVRDKDIVRDCNNFSVSMVITNVRHFSH